MKVPAEIEKPSYAESDDELKAKEQAAAEVLEQRRELFKQMRSQYKKRLKSRSKSELIEIIIELSLTVSELQKEQKTESAA